MGVNYYLKRRSDGSLFDLGKRGKPRSWDSGCSPSTPGRWFKFSSIDEIELALLDSDDGGYIDLFGYTREDISIVALMIWSFGNGSEVRVVYDLDDLYDEVNNERCSQIGSIDLRGHAATDLSH